MLDSIFNSVIVGSVTIASFAYCTITSLVLGVIIALCHTYKTRYTQSFVLTLAVLPVVVQTVIMLINGNIGTGIAVAGAFSLVRFRSAAGTAKEIGSIFLAMTVGLACGVGYLFIAAILAILVSCITLLYLKLWTGSKKSEEKQLKITIPENLDYTELFDDLMEQYTTRHELIRVKTTNMGSLFQLSYIIRLKDVKQEKQFIDEIRCRNGNLDIICGKTEEGIEEL